MYFDLENPRDLARLQNAQLILEAAHGLVVLDEIQRRPELLPLLRVLADRRPLPCRFLILGSASPDMIRGASETLAGRVQFVDMGGFTLDEVGARKLHKLWLRGGFPESYLATADADSWAWRDNFVRTFLERDIPQLGIQIPAATIRRFWIMVAHQHGQIWNASEIGASLGVVHTTARRYLDLLTGAFMVRQLPPWFENVGKRLVKSPKVYIRDSGLFHSLLGLSTREQLESHPKLGAAWEGFALEQVLSQVGERDAYFWATHGGAELDLLLMRRGKRWGIEFKCQDAPTMTKSMHIALADLNLHRLWVVYPGDADYPAHDRVECIALRNLARIISTIV
jgi:predicted AAA+ superfamily ATPase